MMCRLYEVDHHTSEEISNTAWCSLSECSSLEWVSETMHQLAVDGSRAEAHAQPCRADGPPNPYAVYRTSKTEQPPRWPS